jgi:zinc D-Ala-D-Ala carboxypeptidase
MNINEWLSPNFQLHEFLHNRSLEGVTPGVYTNLRALAAALEDVRRACGDNAVHINSGFRTPAHNKEVGGLPDSQHLYGNAADIIVANKTPHEVQEILKDWDGGLGRYSVFTHVDTAGKRRWSGP